MSNIVHIENLNEHTDALAGCACAFGVFDGFHLGHRFLVDQTLSDAASRGCASTVVTFDIDPDELFAPNKLMKLMSNSDRLAALAASGTDHVVVFHFDREFAAREPHEFLDTAFAHSIPASLHVGSDFRFGNRAHGTLNDLISWGSHHNMSVIGHDLERQTGMPITATRIRGLLATGEGIEQANELLGHPFRMSGCVEVGRQEGRDFGFRTANVAIEPNLRALAPGVYAAYTHLDGITYKAAVSIGVSPTFADRTNAYCEAHILDFNGDLYGSAITLDFVAWLQPHRKFDTTEELIETVMGYISWVRNNL